MRRKPTQQNNPDKCGKCRHSKPIRAEHLNYDRLPVLCHCSLKGRARLMSENACKDFRR